METDYFLASAKSIARKTALYEGQDNEQREKRLSDALNNSFEEGQSVNAWLVRAGYIREVPHVEIIEALTVKDLEDEESDLELPWPWKTKLETLEGKSVPYLWRSESELRDWIGTKTIVELPG